MTVRSQAIQIGTADGNDVVVIGGLQPGTLVVSAGVHVLSPGQKVNLYEPRVVANSGGPAQTTAGATAGALPAPAAR
jgi:hypothetical protein